MPTRAAAEVCTALKRWTRRVRRLRESLRGIDEMRLLRTHCLRIAIFAPPDPRSQSYLRSLGDAFGSFAPESSSAADERVDERSAGRVSGRVRHIYYNRIQITLLEASEMLLRPSSSCFAHMIDAFVIAVSVRSCCPVWLPDATFMTPSRSAAFGSAGAFGALPLDDLLPLLAAALPSPRDVAALASTCVAICSEAWRLELVQPHLKAATDFFDAVVNAPGLQSARAFLLLVPDMQAAVGDSKPGAPQDAGADESESIRTDLGLQAERVREHLVACSRRHHSSPSSTSAEMGEADGEPSRRTLLEILPCYTDCGKAGGMRAPAGLVLQTTLRGMLLGSGNAPATTAID